jgi:thioredoxin-related protein
VLRVVFVVWIVACVVGGAYLLSAHLLTLPTPELTDLGPQRSAVAQRRSSQQGQWLAVHILDQECKCSLRVLDHLLDKPRPRGVVERIVLIASDVSRDRISEIQAHGFDLDIVTAEQLAERYRVQAAPLMVVIDPADAVRYVGGYTPRKQADDVRDVAVLEALRRGEPVEPLPTFGCAVGRSLRAKIDPFGIRNWK